MRRSWKWKDNMAPPELVNSFKCFGGFQKVFKHESKVLKCTMHFSIYLPSQAEESKVPVIYYLSGLTCTHENFIHKAGAQRSAEEYGVALVGPDTSPRGCNIEGEDDSYDFGSGAGFYVDATVEKWKTNYNMYSYVTQELPKIIEANFPVDPLRKSVMGHSMGGHGALICFLKNPGVYKSVSAFAPIANPCESKWGTKAFSGYLGPNKESWKTWDATELVKNFEGPIASYILIDQGRNDQFIQDLFGETFVEACRGNSVPVVYRLQEGYDHSYYFISTFVADHVKHHAEAMKQ